MKRISWFHACGVFTNTKQQLGGYFGDILPPINFYTMQLQSSKILIKCGTAALKCVQVEGLHDSVQVEKVTSMTVVRTGLELDGLYTWHLKSQPVNLRSDKQCWQGELSMLVFHGSCHHLYLV